MKFIAFKYRGKKNLRDRTIGNKAEKMLLMIFVLAFISLIFIQTALMNPFIRTFLSANSDLEGIPLAREVFLYSEGKLNLGLITGDRNNDLKVLVNGDVAAEFSYGIVEIYVKDGDVVELDGRAIDQVMEVEVLSKSDNVKTSMVGKRIKVQSDKKVVARVSVN